MTATTKSASKPRTQSEVAGRQAGCGDQRAASIQRAGDRAVFGKESASDGLSELS